jgi:hypothetical protein
LAVRGWFLAGSWFLNMDPSQRPLRSSNVGD